MEEHAFVHLPTHVGPETLSFKTYYFLLGLVGFWDRVLLGFGGWSWTQHNLLPLPKCWDSGSWACAITPSLLTLSLFPSSLPPFSCPPFLPPSFLLFLSQLLFLQLLFYLLLCVICMCVHTGRHVPQHTCGGHREAFESAFSFYPGSWGSNSGHQANVAATSTHWAVSLAPYLFVFFKWEFDIKSTWKSDDCVMSHKAHSEVRCSFDICLCLSHRS